MPMVDSQGVPIHYEIDGDGPPIVLVHGFASSYERNWRRTGWTDYLEAKGRRVIGLDYRGHGDSGKPHDPDAYSGGRMGDDVIAVMDDAGVDQADLMGYSMGGSIALGLLTLQPSRFRSVVIAGAGLGNAPARPERRAAIAVAFEIDDPSTIVDPTVRAFRSFAERSGKNDLRALAAIQRSSYSEPNQNLLREVQHPILAVVGDKDEALAAAQRLVEAISTAELVILPGEDHLSAVLSPVYKQAVSAFLERQALIGKA